MAEEIKRLTATEREVLMRLGLAYEFLATDAPMIEARAKMVKNGPAMLRGACGMINKFLQECYKTISTDQMRTLTRSFKEMSYTVGIKCPATRNNSRREEEYGVIVSIAALNELFAACADHCALCIATPAEAKACKLRKALDSVPNDSEDLPDGGCQYRSVL